MPAASVRRDGTGSTRAWLAGIADWGFWWRTVERAFGDVSRPTARRPPGSRRGASMDKGTGSERSEVPVPVSNLRTRGIWARPGARVGVKTPQPARLLTVRAGRRKFRRYLLSRLWHYHRLWKLNCRVRDGNGCDLPDMVTGKDRGNRHGLCANLTRGGG